MTAAQPAPIYDYRSDEFAVEAARHGGLIETGIEIFESEDLTDTLLSIYLGMMTKGFSSLTPNIPFPIHTLINIYRRGLWLPCTPRAALECQVDAKNDGLPDYAALPIRVGDEWRFVTAQQVSNLPRGWVPAGAPRASYLCGTLLPARRVEKLERRRFATHSDVLNWDGWYFSVIGERLLPTKNPGGHWPTGGPAAVTARFAAAALQTVPDFRFLWTVETAERVLGNDQTTPIRLGVTVDVVRSLFYARTAPMSEAGRRRPILHWVQAHQRRTRLGTSVDIAKHMRGVTEFEMGGFPFRITEPVKRAISPTI